MAKKVKPSWENDRGECHSRPGIEELKLQVKYGLRKLYVGIAETMFSYEGFDDDEQFRDCLEMSRDTVPEVFLERNGELVQFKIGDQLHFLPPVFDGGINMYGKMVEWHPMPVGYDKPDAEKNETFDKIIQLKLNRSNSVLWRNDLFGTGDDQYIDKMVNLLVDNILDTNQLQLIASNPIIFNVTPENLMTAKRVFLDMAEHAPVIYKNVLGDKTVPQVEQLNVKIDPSLFEIFDRFECNLLSYLGFPCVPITKRAQQSVSEVQSNDDKVQLRRLEKLHQREMACERSNRLFGTHLEVHSVIDDLAEQQRQQAEIEQKEMRGNDDTEN